MPNTCPSSVVAPSACTRRVARRSAASKARGTVAVVDEEDVDVGRVGELLAAEPSDTDDGERHRRLATMQAPLRRTRRQRARALAASSARSASPSTSRAPMRRRWRRLNRRNPARRACSSPRHTERVDTPRSISSVLEVLTNQALVVAEIGEEVGLAVQRQPEHPARSEHAARALGREGRLTERVGERGRAGGALGEPAELEQAEVGIGCVRRAIRARRGAIAASRASAG